MSDIDVFSAVSASEAPAAESRWDRFEAQLARISDRLNPILVKEARQALRSKQFIATFMIMLTAGWGWSVFGLTYVAYENDSQSLGPAMFVGFILILGLPLLVVAPFSAFQSLALERQDRTFELVTITSLKARQIITGKLGGVVLQMAVYLSAIVPCLAFTYLLRGLDVVSIGMSVVYLCFVSLGLSVLGLMAASLTPPRSRPVGAGILFALGSFFAMGMTASMIFGVVLQGTSWVDASLWIAHLGILTAYANVFALAFLVARAQLMTECQNRSTALRVAALIAQLSLLGWFSYIQFQEPSGGPLYVCIMFATIGWYYAGIHFTSESAELSPRVMRDLPQSAMGRIFLHCFFPGPGAGFVFVTAGMIALTLSATLVSAMMHDAFGSLKGTVASPINRLKTLEIFQTGVIATSYLVIYVGLGKLLLNFVRRYMVVKMQMRIMLYHLVLLIGCALPWTVQLSLQSMNSSYSLMQITNAAWTLTALCSRGLPFEMPVLIVVLPLAALVVWVINVPGMAREFQQKRIPKPTRMVEEDRELELATAGPPPPTSPWG